MYLRLKIKGHVERLVRHRSSLFNVAVECVVGWEPGLVTDHILVAVDHRLVVVDHKLVVADHSPSVVVP